MATTRIIAMHRNKGCTAEQALKARLDYIKNPEKTREGELVTAFACHAATADAEFALARKEYFEITGRWRENEVIAYQIRQSFKPGEVTPEEAHQIGIELAERYLKGNHAFVVATHTDKEHVQKDLCQGIFSLFTRKIKAICSFCFKVVYSCSWLIFNFFVYSLKFTQSIFK